MMIRDSYGPLIYALPLSLADKTYGTPGLPGLLESEVSAGEGTSKGHTHDAVPGQVGDVQPLTKLEAEYGFAHPALSRPQRTVWIPQDTLGLADEEEKACKDAGVDASLKDAEMNEKGKVDISGPPPDMIQEE
jgi:hypothetical protein